MKLLTWMHHKTQHGDHEVFKKPPHGEITSNHPPESSAGPDADSTLELPGSLYASEAAQLEHKRINGEPEKTLVGGKAQEAFEKKIRASLGELLQGDKPQEKPGIESEQREKAYEDGGNAATMVIARIMRKVGGFSMCSSAAEGEDGECTTGMILQKMSHILHKRVHPERSTKKVQAENFTREPDGANLNKHMCRYNCQSDPTGITLSEFAGSTGVWIKTDAEYHILEL